MNDKINGLVIIPAYNEERNIDKVINDLRTNAEEWDILVIDDGSFDGTVNVVRGLGISIISLPYNLNYGAALQTGFKYAVQNDYDYVVQFDGDGQHDATEINKLLQTQKETNADIVIGSRFFTESGYQPSLLRKLGIWFFGKLTKFITKDTISDPTSGFQLLSKRAFKIYSQTGNFPVDFPDADVYILMKRSGYKIVETPVTMHYRNEGESMHSGIKTFFYVIKMLLSISAVTMRKKISA